MIVSLKETKNRRFVLSGIFLLILLGATVLLFAEENRHDAYYDVSMSADGRYVVYSSQQDNLAQGDNNHSADVFIRNVQSGIKTLVSRRADGFPAGKSGSPVISEDGRFVLFVSSANNIVPGDTNGSDDVFIRDTHAGAVKPVSVKTDGSLAGSSLGYHVSPDGRFVVFVTAKNNVIVRDNNNSPDVFLRDTQTGVTKLVSAKANGSPAGDSWATGLSPSGRFVLFVSARKGIVPGVKKNDTNTFLRDLHAETTKLVQ